MFPLLVLKEKEKKYPAHEFTFVHVCVAILEQSMGVGNPAGIELSYRPSRPRICKPFQEPRNRFPPGWADTTIPFDVPARQAR
jgi:hypothetical protein